MLTPAYVNAAFARHIIGRRMGTRINSGYFSGFSVLSLIVGIGFLCVCLIFWWFTRLNKDSRIPREQLAEAAQVKQTVRQYLVELEQQNPTEEPVHEQEQVSTTDPVFLRD